MGLFGADHGRGERAKKSPSQESLIHTYNDDAWHSPTLPKGDPKNIHVTLHTPSVLLASTFFHRKSTILVVSRNADINCILMHNS